MPPIGDLLATLLRRRTPPGEPLPDAELLARFAGTRDPAAFELLVWRHGPMVLAACRRVLRDAHAAEDAFQATFLVLARKAGGVRGAVAGWLHRVAVRVCLRVKRRLSPAPLDAEPVASPSADSVEAVEQAAILDDEVSRLPDFLRLPVVLCYLQGLTTERAGEVLGIPRGTVLSRLASARKRLAVRLTARGVAPLVAALTIPELSADVGRQVAESAVGFALGTPAPTLPASLATEVLSMTTRRSAVLVAATLVLAAGFGTGVGFVAAQGGSPPTPAPTASPGGADKQAPPMPDAKAAEIRRAKVAKMLDEVNDQIAKLGESRNADYLRTQLNFQEQRLSELITRVRVERVAVPFDLETELDAANERLAAARKAAVPGDVLAEAVKLHPKVVEVQAKMSAKQEELRKSKLPQADAGWKKIQAEGQELANEFLAAQKQVAREVEAYLRTPGVVDAQKAVTAAERKIEQFMTKAEQTREEADAAKHLVAELMEQLAVLEPQADELAWLKEKRHRLKQELLELELHDTGPSK